MTPTHFGTRRAGFGVSGSVTKWWRKRQREKKRLALLALVRQVREQEGDYDRAVSTAVRRNVRRQTQPFVVRSKGRRKGTGLPAKHD